MCGGSRWGASPRPVEQAAETSGPEKSPSWPDALSSGHVATALLSGALGTLLGFTPPDESLAWGPHFCPRAGLRGWYPQSLQQPVFPQHLPGLFRPQLWDVFPNLTIWAVSLLPNSPCPTCPPHPRFHHKQLRLEMSSAKHPSSSLTMSPLRSTWERGSAGLCHLHFPCAVHGGAFVVPISTEKLLGDVEAPSVTRPTLVQYPTPQPVLLSSLSWHKVIAGLLDLLYRPPRSCQQHLKQ